MTISDERLMVIQAVAEGQLPATAITDEEVVFMVDNVLDTMLEEQCARPGISVFWGEENPTVH